MQTLDLSNLSRRSNLRKFQRTFSTAGAFQPVANEQSCYYSLQGEVHISLFTRAFGKLAAALITGFDSSLSEIAAAFARGSRFRNGRAAIIEVPS